jgi:hypothetical protein
MAQTEVQQREEEERLRHARGREALKARIALGLPVLDATPEDLIELREAEERAFASVKGSVDATAREAMIEKQAKQLRDKGNPQCEDVPITINTLRERRP